MLHITAIKIAFMKPKNLSLLELGKGNSQLQTLYSYFQSNTATASMAEQATQIPQKNICRYKRWLQKKGMLWEVIRGNCERTNHQAWYLTTNREDAL